MRGMWLVDGIGWRWRHDDVGRIIGSTVIPGIVKAHTVIGAAADM
jgi:hypothetical protein